jgi:hypothetical protein
MLPDAVDYWDGNWLNCTAEVVVGAFTGRLERALRTDELERFRQELQQLYERLTGEAVLASMEHWIHVRFVGDGRGHVEARCWLCDDPAFGNDLDFRLHLDQTDLPALLRQVATALETYPVIGR